MKMQDITWVDDSARGDIVGCDISGWKHRAWQWM